MDRFGPATVPSAEIKRRRLLIGRVDGLPGIRIIRRKIGRKPSSRGRLIDNLTKDTDSGQKHSSYGVELHGAETEALAQS